MLKYLTMWAGIAATVRSRYRLEEWCWIPGGSDKRLLFTTASNLALRRSLPVSTLDWGL